MIYGSVCSGIEAASVAWEPLGWQPAWFAEVDAFPSAVLAHHYPDVPNLGDFTTIGADRGPIDLLVGGTPCQSFSVAGRRAGLDDPRGNLAVEFCRLAQRLRPRWILWENVPGVLSSWSDEKKDPDGGQWQSNDFDTFLGLLGQCGYGTAWRILDAQYAGVPQRRRRVFVVGYLGDWRPAAAVLFERPSMRRHSAPRTTTREDTADTLTTGSGARRNGQPEDVIPPIAHTLKAQANDKHREDSMTYIPVIAHALTTSMGNRQDATTDTFIPVAQAFSYQQAGGPTTSMKMHPTAPTLSSTQTPAVISSAVRRLTPVECERLQGFPDNWTSVPYRGREAADGPRYKAIGNSMAVPVMAQIGARIQMVDDIMKGLEG